MGLNEEQERDTARIAELEVRRYFDYYLHNVFPEQVRGIKQHTHVAIAGHNTSPKAHGSAEAKINRVLWAVGGITGLVGVAATVKAIFY